ncbi:MAG TPA: Crp/Fnr family transcriptional regulator [Afifellaceae bacterium]|nr:Crp/Fnr family transcriptional regulator [Afifellaceae bacterium]
MIDSLSLLEPLGLRRSLRHLSAGETLFTTGARVAELFIVEKGRVDLIRHMPDGNAIRLQSAGDGALLAEASLFSDSYHCDAEAAGETALLAFPKPEVLDALKARPDAALALLGHFAGRLQALRAQAALFGIRSAQERVLAWLQLQPSDAGIIAIDRPWKQVAGELGLTHEAVYRALASLVRERMIERLDGAVKLRV